MYSGCLTGSGRPTTDKDLQPVLNCRCLEMSLERHPKTCRCLKMSRQHFYRIMEVVVITLVTSLVRRPYP